MSHHLIQLLTATRLLHEQAARTPPPQWVRVVGGWSHYQFSERRMPTLEEINAAAPETPVFILHLYAGALLNRAALVVLSLVLKADVQRKPSEHAYFTRIREALGAPPITVPVDVEGHKQLALEYFLDKSGRGAIGRR